MFIGSRLAGVTQLAEFLLSKQVVMGSRPISRSSSQTRRVMRPRIVTKVVTAPQDWNCDGCPNVIRRGEQCIKQGSKKFCSKCVERGAKK